MPLTEFQRKVLKLLAANRNPENYVAGGIVLNQAPESPRYSDDADLFHDTAESVFASADADAQTLANHGYRVDWESRQPAFQRAVASLGSDSMRLDWAFDSAFRFFPIESEPDLGFRLSVWDAGINKLLALVGRAEPRDAIDVLYFHRTMLSLGATCWAGAGKDPGYTPELLLNEAARLARFTVDDFNALNLRPGYSVQDFRQEWMAAVESARRLIATLPAADVGCLYLNSDGKPVEPSVEMLTTLKKHFGSVRGAWPTVE
ncbi:MAG: hypothetical protein ACLQAT_28080 [Candidatus Binataceae bacterium]